MKSLVIFLMVTFFHLCVWAQQADPGNFQDGILLEQVNPAGINRRQPGAIGVPGRGVGLGLGLNYHRIMNILRSRVSSAEGENNILITQEGTNHTATVNQKGANNAIEVIQQGEGNLYEGTIRGEENLIHILQNGEYNKLYQFVSGRGKELQVVQEGTNLELMQIENGPGGPAYQVHQRGEGMRIKIEHSQFAGQNP